MSQTMHPSFEEEASGTVADPRDLSAFGRTDIENEINDVVEGVLRETKIPTMDRKLILEATTPGHYPAQLWEKFGVKNMPPWSVDEQVEAIIKCIKAGAAGLHSHPRIPDEKYNYGVREGRSHAPELMAEIMDRVFREVDVVTLSHAWRPKDWVGMAEADFVGPTKELLDFGKGNKYIQGNVMPTWINPWSRRGLLSAWFTARSLKEGITYLEENHVKPLIALHMDQLPWFKAHVIDAGVFKTSPHLNIQEGKHVVDRTYADPMSYMNIINSMQLVRHLVPNCTIGLHTGGRNWLPMVVTAVMFGVDVVRVGIEDQFWACPHKDEIMKHPVEAVEKVASIAKALGRDLATAEEARKILGIKLTSR